MSDIDGERNPFQREKVAEFKSRIGIDHLVGVDATDGVIADWRQLTPLLSQELGRLRLLRYHVCSYQSGVGLANWDWERREEQIGIELYVCAAGPAGARARLIEKATQTTTVKSHMALALEKIGELAVEYQAHDGNDILWVFRNVCVSVSNFRCGPKVISVARRIQSFLAAHLVPDFAARVPKIAKVEVSKKSIRVGDTFEVRVLFSEDKRPQDLAIEVRPASWPMPDPIEYGDSWVVFRATHPGRAKLEVIVLDRVTLLCPNAGVVIDVLPAP